MLQTLSIRTRSRNESRDVTAEVEHVVRASGVTSGICYLYVPHTTAGVAINEHADPDVMADVEQALRGLVPHNAGYQHAEGNADAHIKAVMVGASQSVPIENGRLALGTWQGIFFCEFDGPRERKLRVKIMAG
ncbi:MAG: secondary thiamine-phosphate synthase enzyme YjbQ [Acidobacteria bacterium]|nr:secondary thiamine-phosphate synthase enzyme YjbQ [Acidobacteriota bacterium]